MMIVAFIMAYKYFYKIIFVVHILCMHVPGLLLKFD